MSDIAKKTLPPGSWPAKGGKTTPATEDVANSEAAAPRSVVSHTQEQASNAAGALRRPSGGEDDLYSEDHYTTAGKTDDGTARRDGLTEIPEESDANRATSDEGVRSLDELEPEPMADGEDHLPQQQKLQHPRQVNGDSHDVDGDEQEQPSGVQAGDHAAPTGATETLPDDTVRPGEGEATGEDDHDGGEREAAASQAPADGEQSQRQQTGPSSLTDRAKQLFDLASENQPTSEARDNFLQTARSTATGLSKLTGKSKQTQSQQQEEDAPATTVQGDVEGEVPEGQTVGDEPPTEMGEEGQEHLEDAEGMAPTELGSQQLQEGGMLQPQITPSQLGSDVPTEVRNRVAQLQQQQQEDVDQMQQPQITPSLLGSDVPTEIRDRIMEAQAQGQQITPSQLGSDVPTEVRDRVAQLQQQQQEEVGVQQPQITPSQLGSGVPTDIRDRIMEAQAQGQQITPSQLGSDVPTEVRDRVAQLQQQQQQQQEQAQTPGSQAPDTEKVNTYKPAETIPSTEMQDQLAADFAMLKNGRVNKGGNVVGEDGRVVGRVTQGALQYLIGRTVDEEGNIWSPSGKVIGRAEPLSEDERDELVKEPAPFESFPGATVNAEGYVVADNGEIVGKVVAGDLHVLRGKEVDPEGDIMDRAGNVIGKAERWEPEPEEEPEPEPEVDRSILAGKRVNKAGNVVDGSGTIYGRVVEGDPKAMVGRMCDKYGNILSESGDVLGRAEVVSEGEREGLKEGPFAELEGCTVAKDGTVVTPAGDIVGRLVSGNPKVLFGRAVDEDGDVLDRNGNVIGKAERWEPDEVERKKNPMSGRRVNKQGEVVDEDGNLIGKLTSGNVQVCSGKEIDDDGDVVDYKGTVIGHCSLLEDIPDEVVEEESAEDKAKREQVETDRKLAQQMAACISQCLDKIRPICKMITEKIDREERKAEDERDEEGLVREVRPLIEEGGRILDEAKGIIKGLDPDGRISAQAKHKTAAREATPEEYHLADVLKDLTGDVTQCIENAKRKLEDMPHAKKELNPLWGLLNEPLFQILAAVGLLLNGVLSLVGRLLSGLGLGGLVDGLLGTLGINRVLEGLGLGSVSKSLTGGGKKKSGSGGLLGGLLGGS